MEGRVADLLVAGVDVAGIAEQLGISTETVRFYLKAIFRKTGTGRQSELVRLAMGLPGVG
jgi:DNA-binding CsgD family transcriptional regulator